MTVAQDIINYTGGILKKDDPVVTALIADFYGIPEAVITESADYNEGSISNELELLKAYINLLTDYYDLAKSKDLFLDYLGSRLGTLRALGELDEDYYNRIYSRLKGEKLTPYALRKILEIFSPNFVLVQEGVAGVGYLNRSFLGIHYDGTAGFSILTSVLAQTNVNGIITTYTTNDTFQVNDTTGFAVNDEIWHNVGSTNRLYSIEEIQGNNIIIDTRGYVGGVLTSGVLQITGLSSGTVIKYEPSIFRKCFLGSITAGVLQIRITLEDLPALNEPVIARFFLDLINDIKVPGSEYEIIKVII